MDRKPPYELTAEELAYISRYLNGELDGDERQVFEGRLSGDETLRQKVAEVNGLILGVKEANLALELDSFHGDIASVKSVPMYRRWWAAASVALLVLIGAWWVWVSAPSDERLYQAYFEPDMGLPVTMSATDTIGYAFYDGMISFKERNYADALTKWEELTTIHQDSDTLRYFNGVAYMGLDQTDKAIEQLLAVASERQSKFYESATWYLALCYLRKGDEKTAASLLKRISNRGQALELLKKLE